MTAVQRRFACRSLLDWAQRLPAWPGVRAVVVYEDDTLEKKEWWRGEVGQLARELAAVSEAHRAAVAAGGWNVRVELRTASNDLAQIVFLVGAP